MSTTITTTEDDDGRVVGYSFACSRGADRRGQHKPAQPAAAAAETKLGAGDVRFTVGTRTPGLEWFTAAAAPDRQWKRFAVLYDTAQGELVACECGAGNVLRCVPVTCEHADAVAAWVEQRRRKAAWLAEHGELLDDAGWE